MLSPGDDCNEVKEARREYERLLATQRAQHAIRDVLDSQVREETRIAITDAL